MAREMTLRDLKDIVDGLIGLHPEAKVDFIYPVMFRGQRKGRVGELTSYKVVLGAFDTTARFVLAHADPRGEMDDVLVNPPEDDNA